MALVLLEDYRLSAPIQCGVGGPEMQPGDSAKLFLDTTTTPAFPEFIFAMVIAPVTEVPVLAGLCSKTLVNYIFQYETDDLDGAKPFLQASDILLVECSTCCSVINARIDGVVASLAPVFGTFSPPGIAPPFQMTTEDVLLVDNTLGGGTTSVLLPDPATRVIGKILTIKNRGTDPAHTVSILPFASELIDGSNSADAPEEGGSIGLFTDGTDWFIAYLYTPA